MPKDLQNDDDGDSDVHDYANVDEDDDGIGSFKDDDNGGGGGDDKVIGAERELKSFQ